MEWALDKVAYLLFFVSHFVVSFPANDFDKNHSCHGNPDVPQCNLLYEVKNPDLEASAIDLYTVPHRGLWDRDTGNGPGSGPPENSVSAVQQAYNNGYSFVELDVMMTKDQEIVCSHDYPTFRTTNSNDHNQYVFNTDQSLLAQLNLIRRNGTVSGDTMMTGGGLLDVIDNSGLILVLDPKEPIGRYVSGSCVEFCDNEYYKKVNWLLLVAKFLDDANDANLLGRIAVKTFLFPNEILDGVTEVNPNTKETKSAQGLGISLMSQVLWIPMLISSQHDNNINNLLGVVQSWNSSDYAPMLFYIETDFKNASDVQIQPFQEYQNIMHYIADVVGIRSGLFAEEPIAPRGNYTRWAVGKMKNSGADRRADLPWVLSNTYSGYMVITSDVPEIWEQIR